MAAKDLGGWGWDERASLPRPPDPSPPCLLLMGSSRGLRMTGRLPPSLLPSAFCLPYTGSAMNRYPTHGSVTM